MKRGKTRNAARLSVMLIALMLLGGFLAGSPQAAQSWKMTSVDMAGIDGANNNVAVLDERTFLVAPYAPSKQPGYDTDLGALDNHFAYFIDLKRPAADPPSTAIETATGEKKVYYPTKVIFDDNGQTLYVRGTRFELVAGGVNAIAVIAYAQVNRDGNGKPVFSEWVVIDIPDVGSHSEAAVDAPDTMVLGFEGKYLYFTNGASVFSYNIKQGYLYEVDLVTKEAFNAGGLISYLGVDETTHTLSVYWNRPDGDGATANTLTELSFYSLSDKGTMQLLKRLYPNEEFPERVYIPTGSNIQLVGVDKEGKPLFAYVATSDGSLNQIDLTGAGVSAPLKSLYRFDSLAAPEGGADANPRFLKFDPATRLIGIVKQGYTAQSRRPSNGRRGQPGSVIRTLSLPDTTGGPPALVVARLGKKLNTVVGNKDLSDAFGNEIGLASLVDGRGGQWLTATHSGKLLSLNTTVGVDALQLELLTEVGDRTGRIAYFGARDSIVAVNSFSLDAAQQQISIPGQVVVARPNGINTQSYSVSSASTASSVSSSRAAGAQGPTLSARRPCNISKK